MIECEELKLSGIVGSGLCIAASDGQKVFAEIEASIRSGRKVCLSFQGVEDLTSAFLNCAVGQLYGKFPEQQISEMLTIRVESASDEDLILLNRVTERARDFFKHPQRHKAAAKNALGDDYGN